MSETPDPRTDRPTPVPPARDTAKARLAAALKANMARRKAQARARDARAADAPTEEE